MRSLEPCTVWAHFATLCATPRPSGGEAALRAKLLAWAEEHGIDAAVDPVGNLVLRKPASAGAESRPGVILQGHLDMVCQANAGTVHDFTRDPIRASVRDGWVVAEDTTLGADNGIGVALALAALEAPELVHPALEVLLTVAEESGMDGARALAANSLHGQTLINLDTEEWGHFYLGCAGGLDVEVNDTLQATEIPEGYAVWRLEVAGLRGGHSGIDIHLGRGNAIKLIAEAMQALAEQADLHLLEMHGGTARNAIPREAQAVFALPASATAWLQDWTGHRAETWCQRYGATDPALSLVCLALAERPGSGLAGSERDRLLDFLTTAANGVAEYSADFPGVVETSDNLGVLRLTAHAFQATFKVRSLVDAEADALAERLLAHARGHGLAASKGGGYPSWRPNPASPLLALCQRTYQEQFGTQAQVQVIHAGLECGLFAGSHPNLDMISFGPDIRGAHAPGERVEVASVERCWHLLRAVLRALAGA